MKFRHGRFPASKNELSNSNAGILENVIWVVSMLYPQITQIV